MLIGTEATTSPQSIETAPPRALTTIRWSSRRADCNPDGGRTPRRAQLWAGPEALKIVEVARPPSGALHGDQVIAPAYTQGDAVQLARDRRLRQLGVRQLGVEV